jgi:hypothetical protein
MDNIRNVRILLHTAGRVNGKIVLEGKEFSMGRNGYFTCDFQPEELSILPVQDFESSEAR